MSIRSLKVIHHKYEFFSDEVQNRLLLKFYKTIKFFMVLVKVIHLILCTLKSKSNHDMKVTKVNRDIHEKLQKNTFENL